MRVDRFLMVLILMMQVVIMALFFHSRRQHEDLGNRDDAKAPTPTQGALVLPSASLSQTTAPTALESPGDITALEQHVTQMRAEMDRRIQELSQTPTASHFHPTFPSLDSGFDLQIRHMMENAMQEFRALESSAHFDEGWTRLIRSPALDMQDKGSHYLVVCSLPGLGQDDVEVTLEGRLLTILGQSSAGARQPVQQTAHYERRVWLPGPVDTGDSAHATISNGVLRVTVPKAEAMPQVAKLTRLM
ncbi:MAG: Hsp20/alpha crystallin family protein [Lentisphaerae bacterium]|nr:Hsp20/alpha crystallin family protein [Lentisphaerota bacterium]